MVNDINKFLNISIDKLIDDKTLKDFFEKKEFYLDDSYRSVIKRICNVQVTDYNYKNLVSAGLKYGIKSLLYNCEKYFQKKYNILLTIESSKGFRLETLYDSASFDLISNNVIDYLIETFNHIHYISRDSNSISIKINKNNSEAEYVNFINSYHDLIEDLNIEFFNDLSYNLKNCIFGNCENVKSLTFINYEVEGYDEFSYLSDFFKKLTHLNIFWLSIEQESEEKNMISISNIQNLETIQIKFSKDIKTAHFANLPNVKKIKIFSLHRLENIYFENVPTLEYIEVSNCPRLLCVSGLNEQTK